MKEYTFYRIVCKNPEIKDCYVGSTSQFKNRKWLHKSESQNINSKHYNVYLYQVIRENGGFENFNMLEIEKLELETKQESLKRERYWFDFYKATLNQNIPSRSKKEYHDDNIEHLKKCAKLNSEKNKEEIKEKKKLYREKNIEIIKEKEKIFRENNKEKIKVKDKIYREKNEEKIKISQANKYEKNKEKIKEQRKEKTTCKCGSIFLKHCIKRHEQTLKHQEFIKNNT